MQYYGRDSIVWFSCSCAVQSTKVCVCVCTSVGTVCMYGLRVMCCHGESPCCQTLGAVLYELYARSHFILLFAKRKQKLWIRMICTAAFEQSFPPNFLVSVFYLNIKMLDCMEIVIGKKFFFVLFQHEANYLFYYYKLHTSMVYIATNNKQYIELYKTNYCIYRKIGLIFCLTGLLVFLCMSPPHPTYVRMRKGFIMLLLFFIVSSFTAKALLVTIFLNITASGTKIL